MRDPAQLSKYQNQILPRRRIRRRKKRSQLVLLMEKDTLNPMILRRVLRYPEMNKIKEKEQMMQQSPIR